MLCMLLSVFFGEIQEAETHEDKENVYSTYPALLLSSVMCVTVYVLRTNTEGGKDSHEDKGNAYNTVPKDAP